MSSYDDCFFVVLVVLGSHRANGFSLTRHFLGSILTIYCSDMDRNHANALPEVNIIDIIPKEIYIKMTIYLPRDALEECLSVSRFFRGSCCL